MSYYTQRASPHQFWFWLIPAAIVCIPVLLTLAAALLRARGYRSVLRAAWPPSVEARARARRVTRWGLTGLGAGAVVGIVPVAHKQGWLGVLACGAGYLGGLLLAEYTAQPPIRGPVRAARLLARRPTDYIPSWALAAAALPATLVLAAPFVYAVAPVVHYPGCPRGDFCVTFAGGPVPAGQTYWPTWPGTAVAAAVAVAALVVGAAGLRRVAARPGPTSDREQAVDEILRRQTSRAITGAVVALEMFDLAVVLILGGEGLGPPFRDKAPGAYFGSRVMEYAGVGCMVVGLTVWLALTAWTGRRLQPSLEDAASAEPGS